MANSVFHHNDAAYIVAGSIVTSLYQLSKKTKTRSVRTPDGGTIRLNTENILVDKSTYCKINSYCQMTESYDTVCYLCMYYGSTAFTCKCKEHFTVEEHYENIKIARRNYFITHLEKDGLLEYIPIIQGMTDEQVHNVMYSKDRYGSQVYAYEESSTFEALYGRREPRITKNLKTLNLKL